MKSRLGIFTTDANLRIRSWDQWLEGVTGHSTADVVGKYLKDVIPEIEERGLLNAFNRVLAQGSIELLAPVFHKFLIACPPQPASQMFSLMQQRVVVAPLREASRITGLLVTIEDVTARREREQHLADGLGHEDWRVRRDAVEALRQQDSETSALDLIATLRRQHRDAGVLNSLLQILVANGHESVAGLLELATDEDAELRMYAALALGDIKDGESIPELVKLLHDTDRNVKYHAIEALSKLRSIEAVDSLVEIAEAGDFFLAFPALDALAAIGEPRIAPRLVPLLENEILQAAVVGALAELGDETLVPELVSLIDRPGMVSPVTQALSRLHQRFENSYSEGSYVIDLVRKHASPVTGQNLLSSLNGLTGDPLRIAVRVLGWVQSERTVSALVQLLSSREVRNEVIETLVRHGREVTPLLCEQLNAQELDTRRAAITALARIGDPESVPPLLEVLEDPDLMIEAATALSRIGDGRAYEPLIKLLGHERAAVRQAAIGALNSLGHPRTLPDIKRMLFDSNPHVRESAVRIAGYFGYPECADEVLDRVHDVDENVRKATVEVLPNLPDSRALSALLRAAHDESPKIRGAAIQSFAYIENVQALPQVLQALKDQDAWVRYYAARSLGHLGSLEAIDDLAATLQNDTASQVRIAAADALGSIGGSKAVSILGPLVDADDQDLARAALMALGKIGHPDALHPIMAILRSPQASRRMDAVRAISARRDDIAVETLQWVAVADTDRAISDTAIEQLCVMGTPASIASLIRLTAERALRECSVGALARLDPAHIERIAEGLARPQIEVRRAIVDALGRMKHPSASDVLSRALDDDEAQVRLAAIMVLRRLGSHRSERTLAHMAHGDPDPAVRQAAQKALER